MEAKGRGGAAGADREKSAEVTLEEVLAFREQKAWIQSELLGAVGRASYPAGDLAAGMDCPVCGDTDRSTVVVSLGMNIPGPVKCGPSVKRAFEEGQRELEQLIDVLPGRISRKKVLGTRAGYAAIYLIRDAKPQEIKRAAINLEETHRLGRIWDIDVLKADGTAVTRRMLGADGRKCLLCGRDAKVCGRSRSHSVEELQERVREIIGRVE